MPDIDRAPEIPVATAGLGSRALRNTILVLAAKVVARLIALVTVIATLRWLTPAPYGTFTTLVNYTAIVSVVLDLGFNVLYVREGARHPAEIQRYLRNVMSLRVLMAVASFVVLAIALAVAGL
ncbi:MAG TPA: oligosaccharide flippase family protein, partial [Candidatus Dormibacteraeota bacterium]